MTATAGRFLDAYGASMDSTLAAKIVDIEPWLIPGLVVDRGCGTGALMRYLSKNWDVVGIDRNTQLAKREPGVINADVLDPVFADGFVDNIVLSSVMHEVFSYNGYSLEPVRLCLANCAQELKYGGRIIIRDVWSPERQGVHLRFTPHEEERELFTNFLKGTPMSIEPGEVELKEWTTPPPGQDYVSASERVVVEFLSKKDYKLHWDLELKEVYTSVTMQDYRDMAKPLGLKVLAALPITNQWIVQKRYKIGVEGEVPQYTNQVIVFSK